MLVDAVEAAERVDLLSELTEMRLDAEREVVNALKFGLGSTLTITSKPGAAGESPGSRRSNRRQSLSSRSTHTLTTWWPGYN
jgi:hypothetical protein